MTLEEWYEQLFKYATGWLGYTPDVALNSNVAHLELALEGKIDFLRKTNPWGSSKSDVNSEVLSPENVAKKFEAWAIGMQGSKPPTDRGERKKEGIILPEGMSMSDILGIDLVNKNGG